MTDDEFLNDQLDFASYVLRKGILSQELSQGQPVTETCNIVREAVSAISGFYAANQSAEELKPSQFAPIALWYIIIKPIFEKINQICQSSEGTNPLRDH